MTLRLALTPGEPAGIGPDLTIALAQRGSDDEIVVIADTELLRERAKTLQLPLSVTHLRKPSKSYNNSFTFTKFWLYARLSA